MHQLTKNVLNATTKIAVEHYLKSLSSSERAEIAYEEMKEILRNPKPYNKTSLDETDEAIIEFKDARDKNNFGLELSKIQNQMEYIKEEIECIHLFLDSVNAPKIDQITFQKYSINGRIKALLEYIYFLSNLESSTVIRNNVGEFIEKGLKLKKYGKN